MYVVLMAWPFLGYFPIFLLDWIVDEEARQGPFPLAAAGRNPCLSE
jgi:hypothetical protein